VSVVTAAFTTTLATAAATLATSMLTALVLATLMLAVMVLAGLVLTAVIIGILALVVATLLRAGGGIVVILVAIAGVGFDRIIMVAGSGNLVIIAWRGDCCRSSVIGELTCECIRCHENAQRTDRSRYQQGKLLHRFLQQSAYQPCDGSGFYRWRQITVRLNAKD